MKVETLTFIISFNIFRLDVKDDQAQLTKNLHPHKKQDFLYVETKLLKNTH